MDINIKGFITLLLILIIVIATIRPSGAIEQQKEKWDVHKYYYPNTINKNRHPIVKKFFNLSIDEYIDIYCIRYPLVNKKALKSILEYKPKYCYWIGNDLFPIFDHNQKKMLVIESNSCPSGQKSLPIDDNMMSGYYKLIKESFLPLANQPNLPTGYLAVIYDTNEMENMAYAQVIKHLSGEKVFLYKYNENEQNIHYLNRILYLRDKQSNQLYPIRAVFRYVTQKPWKVIPFNSRTLIFNPIEVCFAGGRNKQIASLGYLELNRRLNKDNLSIVLPTTINNLNLNKTVQIVKNQFYGKAVIKNPYSNKGQGVFTILDETDLTNFINYKHHYDNFIVQSLIGPKGISSSSEIYHRGTKPDIKGNQYIYDLRMMCAATDNGLRPITCYARRALYPFSTNGKLVKVKNGESWNILGTNLSIKENGNWTTDNSRLIPFSEKDFQLLGLDLFDLVEGYVQTALSLVSIDMNAQKMFNSSDLKSIKNNIKKKNNDSVLLNEILEIY